MSFLKTTSVLVFLACLAAAPGAGVDAAPVCHVSGQVYCSEYGTRYNRPVEVVFVGQDGSRYAAPLGDSDGVFRADIPGGSPYEVRLEFSGHGFPVGRLDISGCAGGCAKDVSIYYSGSMLELVWRARKDKGGGVDMKVR